MPRMCFAYSAGGSRCAENLAVDVRCGTENGFLFPGKVFVHYSDLISVLRTIIWLLMNDELKKPA
ncbi:hypothetical protein PCURB6_15360 [Paenibacillus curdlanolyticus]|nr:hypothetical protein PCURB6_15360 [Paenibacillus curdlanolyticus]